MTPKEKAQELVDKFKYYVHGYVGSSMLTNHEYPEQILAQAKKVTIITVDEIINSQSLLNDDEAQLYDGLADTQYLSYWEIVKSEIELLC